MEIISGIRKTGHLCTAWIREGERSYIGTLHIGALPQGIKRHHDVKKKYTLRADLNNKINLGYGVYDILDTPQLQALKPIERLMHNSYTYKWFNYDCYYFK